MPRHRGTVSGAALAAVLAVLLVPGCTSVRSAAPELSPRFARALQGLERAVAAEEDELARRLLARVYAAGPEGRALEVARGYERVLDGRAVADALEFFLRSEPIEGAFSEGSYRMALVCRTTGPDPVRLVLPPPTLEVLTHQLFITGSDSRSVENRVVDEWGELMLVPGEVLRLELGDYRVELGDALARRDVWRMETRSGDVWFRGELLPLRAPAVEAAEVVRVAAYFSPEPVEPEALLEYVARPRISLPGLLERAVRIEPSRWAETLERLAPVAAELSDQRLADIAPALRWLSRSAKLGGDPRAWRVALARSEATPALPAGLDLPDPKPAPDDPER